MGFSFHDLRLKLGETASSFNLEAAVCNHGFFMMTPNRWFASTKTLERPLRLSDSVTSVTASISHPCRSYVLIRVHTRDDRHLSSLDHLVIRGQVSRMLRISQKDERDVKGFHEMHSEAKEVNFGRIFRSPTLFEDIIKSMLLCNCTWSRTLKMCRALCELQPELVHGMGSHLEKDEHYISGDKRKRGEEASLRPDLLTDDEKQLGNFPSPEELVRLDEHILRVRCNLGYRAGNILKFAKKVFDGTVKVEELDEAKGLSCGEVYKRLMEIKGLGPFTCSSILMCMGFYEKVPADSETINLLKEVHARTRLKTTAMKKDLEDIYGKYSPFQCLAYWFELIGLYEIKFGKLSEMESSRYCTVASSFHSKVVINQRKVRVPELTSHQETTIKG